MKYSISTEKTVPTDDYGFDARIVKTQIWEGDHMPSDTEIAEVASSQAEDTVIITIRQQRRLHLGQRAIQHLSVNEISS